MGNDISNIIPKSQARTDGNYMKLRKFWTVKENMNRVRGQLTEFENYQSDKGFITRLYQETFQNQQQGLVQ